MPDHTDLELTEKAVERLTVKALELIEAIDSDRIEAAPLNQITSALATVLDRLMKLQALLYENQPKEEVIRIEYHNPDGTISETPPWAEDDQG